MYLLAFQLQGVLAYNHVRPFHHVKLFMCIEFVNINTIY
jgi:hypothetical protein